MEQFKPKVDQILKDRIRIVKEMARQEVVSVQLNPKMSLEQKSESLKGKREDAITGAKASGLSDLEIEEVVRAFDVEVHLLTEELNQDQELAA